VEVDDTDVASITTEQFRRHFFFDIDPAGTPPDAAVTVTVPAIQRGLFAARNNTAQEVIRIYTSDDTWNKPANLDFVVVEVVGAGGGSGGCPATGAGEQVASAGGGAGATAIKKIAAASLGATETVTVGSAPRDLEGAVDAIDGGADHGSAPWRAVSSAAASVRRSSGSL
jgi:hypothetical protein